MSSSSSSSDTAVSSTLSSGWERLAWRGSVGLVVGTLAGLVLIRTPGSAVRKGLSGLGAGLGLGSAWTQTSMELEALLSSSQQK